MILLILFFIVLFFAVVVLFGAPYLPTHKRQVEVALDLLDIKAGMVVVDLGAGDGVFLKAAARRGAVVHGYELNPILCAIAWLRCLRYRKQVHLHMGNYWRSHLPAKTDAVFVFLLARFMRKLDKKLEAEVERQKHSLRLASYTFAIPGKQALEVKEGVFLYEYPFRKR